MTKVKTETQEQRAKRLAREKKELAKWEKERSKKSGKWYFWYLLLIVAIAFAVDEISTQINVQMQTEIAIGLFQDRMSIMQIVSMLSLPLMACAVFYKALSDKYGRKLFLCINTMGMGLGLFLVFLAGKIAGMSGIVLYVIAGAMINFFIPNDTQVIYLMESAQNGKRGTMVAGVKFFATLSVMLIPLMRSIFMGDDQTRWYLVYLTPAFLGIFAAVMCFIGMREPEAFVSNRIAYLKTPFEERGQKENAGTKQGGIGTAFKFMFRHKQLRWLTVSTLIWGLGAFGIQYYSRILANYYSTEEVTAALMLYPVTCAIVLLINGVGGDKFGRKALTVAMAATAFVSFGLMFVSCHLHWDPVIAGLCVGAFTGSYYSAGDNIYIYMSGESAPTKIRASVMSAQGVVNMVSKMLATLVPMVALLLTHDNYNVLGWLCLLGSLPAMFAALFILITKVGDTSKLDLKTIRGDEWD